MTAAPPRAPTGPGPWDDWARSLVEIDLPTAGVLLRPIAADDPGEPGDDDSRLRGLLPSHCWIITACDPHPERLSAEENLARTADLDLELVRRGIAAHPALGRAEDHSVSEVSRALVGTDRGSVLAVAAAFGQLAVFEVADRIDCIEVATARVRSSHRFAIGRRW